MHNALLTEHSDLGALRSLFLCGLRSDSARAFRHEYGYEDIHTRHCMASWIGRHRFGLGNSGSWR